MPHDGRCNGWQSRAHLHAALGAAEVRRRRICVFFLVCMTVTNNQVWTAVNTWPVNEARNMFARAAASATPCDGRVHMLGSQCA